MGEELLDLCCTVPHCTTELSEMSDKERERAASLTEPLGCRRRELFPLLVSVASGFLRRCVDVWEVAVLCVDVCREVLVELLLVRMEWASWVADEMLMLVGGTYEAGTCHASSRPWSHGATEVGIAPD